MMKFWISYYLTSRIDCIYIGKVSSFPQKNIINQSEFCVTSVCLCRCDGRDRTSWDKDLIALQHAKGGGVQGAAGPGRGERQVGLIGKR